ncbi:MAG: hypothetical protein HOP30_16360 [Cyclobacteriaceae bacterium]|nr:hypothetical protein [Cyclobacteriaceae bacterium]
MKYILVFVCALLPIITLSQSLHYDTLLIPKRTALMLTTDSLFVNHFIMGDSSTIILGAQTTLIKTFRLEAGVNCSIIGDGMDAIIMKDNSLPLSLQQAVRGENGKSLTLISTIFDTKSILSIYLNGGNGSDGGLFALPGEGGAGGNLFFISSYSEKKKVDQQINLKNEGGYPGRPRHSAAGMEASSLPTRKKGDFRIIANK